MYTVKETSEIMNLSEHTLRYYSDMGLVPNLKRDKNNNRIYDKTALNWLKGVKYLKACGMSLKDIKNYVTLCLKGECTVQERYEIIIKWKNKAEAQLIEAEERVKYMEEKARHYYKIMNGAIPDDTNPDGWR